MLQKQKQFLANRSSCIQVIFKLMYSNQRAKNNTGADFRQSYTRVLGTQFSLQQHISYLILTCKTQLFLPQNLH